MSAWHTEDKEWMKERKRQWASVSKRVSYLYFIDSEWKPVIKHYFLTGELKKDSHSLKNFQFAPFFALWFHPDDSLQNWQHMREKLFDDWQWRDSASRIREVLHELWELPEGGVGSFLMDGMSASMTFSSSEVSSVNSILKWMIKNSISVLGTYI